MKVERFHREKWQDWKREWEGRTEIYYVKDATVLKEHRKDSLMRS